MMMLMVDIWNMAIYFFCASDFIGICSLRSIVTQVHR